MSLDGLRAWIGEVERKLGVRTRVFLALTAIAVGGAAAGVYLGLDAQSNEVSKGDVEAVETRLLEQIGAGGAPQVSQLEAQVQALQAEVAALQEDGSTTAPQEGTTGATGSTGATGAAPKGEATGAAQAGGSSASAKALQKQLEEAAQNEEQTKSAGDGETKKGER